LQFQICYNASYVVLLLTKRLMYMAKRLQTTLL